MNILIVDDDEVALMVLEETLRQAGHDVSIARNGREALERMRQGECRVIVSDWEMPEMNGLELFRSIRADHYRGYVYLILLTGRDTSSERVEGLQAGADDFIGKPFDPSELLARIGTAERVLSMKTRHLGISALAYPAESRF